MSVGVIDGCQAVAVISQVRLIDTKRLYKQIGTLNKKIFESVQKAVRDMF